jgi:hypothetical protein
MGWCNPKGSALVVELVAGGTLTAVIQRGPGRIR